MKLKNYEEYVQLIKRKHYFINYFERKRLAKLPRHVSTSTYFLGNKLEIVDRCTFVGGVDEIFTKNLLKFKATTNTPLIIDCGANIGLSVLFFNHLYPDSRIIAFEPDPQIFNALKNNIAAFGLSNVELYNKAIWSSETNLEFWAEGGFSGRIVKQGDNKNIIKVKTARLKNFLEQKVDFLKIDIEGAEYEVLKDCADQLFNVENLFVEYHSHISERQTLHDILSIICKAGFRYHIKDAHTNVTTFMKRAIMLGMDLQLNIFAFRCEKNGRSSYSYTCL